MSFITQALMQAKSGVLDDAFIALNTIQGLNTPIVTNSIVLENINLPKYQLGAFHSGDFFVVATDSTIFSHRWNAATSNYDLTATTVLSLPSGEKIFQFTSVRGVEGYQIIETGVLDSKFGDIGHVSRLLKLQPDDSWVEIVGGPFPQTEFVSDGSTYERRLSIVPSKDYKTFWTFDAYSASTTGYITGPDNATTRTIEVWSYDQTSGLFTTITGSGNEVLSAVRDAEYTAVTRRWPLVFSHRPNCATTNGGHCASLIDYNISGAVNTANSDTGPSIVFYSSTSGTPIITKFIHLEDGTLSNEVAMMSHYDIVFPNNTECHLTILFGVWIDNHSQYNAEWKPGRLSTYVFHLVGTDWVVKSVNHSVQNSLIGSVRPENKPKRILISENGGLLLTYGYQKYLSAEASLTVETEWRQLYEFDVATSGYSWLETQQYVGASGDPSFPYIKAYDFNLSGVAVNIIFSGNGTMHLTPVYNVDSNNTIASNSARYISVRA